MKKVGIGKRCVRKSRNCKNSKSQIDFKGRVSTIRLPLPKEVSEAIAVSELFHGCVLSTMIRSELIGWMCDGYCVHNKNVYHFEECQSRVCEMIGEYENGIDDVPAVVFDVPISVYEDLKHLGLILGGLSVDYTALVVIVHILDFDSALDL